MFGGSLHKCLRILPPTADVIKRKIWPLIINQSRFQQFVNPNSNYTKSVIVDLNEAFVLFDAMIDSPSFDFYDQDQILPLWSKIVSVVMQGQCYYDVIEMYRRIRIRFHWAASILDIQILSMLVNCYCCIGCVNYGFGVLGMVVKMGVEPDVVFFNTLVKGLALEKRIDEAFWVLYDIMDGFGSRPNDTTFGTLFQGLCSAGHLEVAVELIKRMDCMNLVCYNVIIDCLIRRGLVYEAEEMMSDMWSKGLRPDGYTYNSFIYFWSCASQLNKAKNAFCEMKEQGIYPDVVTYSSLIYGLCRVGVLKEAMYLFSEMKEIAVSPNVVTYSSLIYGLCRAGQLDEAILMFDEMKSNDVAPNVVTYSSIIHGLCCAAMK